MQTNASFAPNIAFIEAMERAVISQDRNEALRYLSSDVIYRVGAHDAVVGVDAIFEYVSNQSRVARWDGHTLIAVWPNERALIVEVISHFTRVADNRRMSFPCTDIYRFREDRMWIGGCMPTCPLCQNHCRAAVSELTRLRRHITPN